MLSVLKSRVVIPADTRNYFDTAIHSNFATPNLSMFSGTAVNPIAGTITKTSGNGNGRQIQFALRVEF